MNIAFLKKLLIILLSVFTINSFFAQEITVDFEGKVSNDNVVLSEVIVQVLQNGKLLTTFKTDNTGSYNIYLPLGNEYLIAVSKDKYVQKYFTVNTKGIPQEQAGTKFPTITADVDLFKYYDGVDYSLFNEPINKFYYNPKKGNFEYDKDLLKEKKEAMRLVKQAERKAILASSQKKDEPKPLANKPAIKKTDSLKTTEPLATNAQKSTQQNAMQKAIEEDKPLLKSERERQDIKLNIVAADNTASKKIIDKKVNDLLLKYKQGVTEERQEARGVIIIKRVVVREEQVWVYEKKIFDWGGISYFRDKQRITASTFNIETSGK